MPILKKIEDLYEDDEAKMEKAITDYGHCSSQGMFGPTGTA
jgi:hypothetical protein